MAADGSSPKPYENLMIVYYDMLLLDDRSLLDIRHSERFKLLERTIHCDKGRAELVPRQVVDFGGRYAISDLRQAFAKTIVERGEGLVLKPDDPYFNFHDSSKRFCGLCIKLKKEYIGNFGDIGDFAVVGAGFNASKARSYMIPDLKWTHFFLGCLENREEVKRWNATPEFTVVTVVELNETQLKSLLAFGNPMPVEPTINVDTRLKIPRGLETNTPMCFAFRNPLVFDLRCFSFDKPGNMGFWTPRFPAVSKIHFDRDYTDTISLEELQEKAKEATTGTEMDDSQENLAWIARLEGADPRGRAVDAVSQLTATTMPTPSPVKSTQATSESDPRLSPVAFRSVGRASVNLGQVLHTATREFAVPRVPLITPPSSSLPEEAASPTACANAAPRKRQSKPVLETSPAPKRQRVESNQRDAAPPKPDKVRRPLTDIDGNASQQSAKSLDSVSAQLQQDDEQAGDGWGSPILVISGPGERDTTNTPDGAPKATAAVACAGNGASCARSKAEVRCKYAGAGCHLTQCPVFFATECLRTLAEARAHIEEHGIEGASVLDPTWLTADGHPAVASPNPRRGQSAILLVDSMNKADETRELLVLAEEVRRKAPRGKRRWISVYDWRLLRYLTVLEDKTVRTKYYDGFDDPWRRWYCGMI